MTAPRVLSIDDLPGSVLDAILERARHHLTRASPASPLSGTLVGLAFFESSLRTKFGFSAAASRLGITTIAPDVREGHHGGPPESLHDTLRTLAGYVDIVVVRSGKPALEMVRCVPKRVAFINGGDGGPHREHPTQALIDLFAIERIAGSVADLHITVLGDLEMRAARSLLRILQDREPARLSLVGLTGQRPDRAVSPERDSELSKVVSTTDVLYAVGIPHGVPEEERSRLRVDRRLMDRLPAHAAVLSPMPVIDEISSTVRDDPRIRVFEQNDLAQPVRMAVLEHALGSS